MEVSFSSKKLGWYGGWYQASWTIEKALPSCIFLNYDIIYNIHYYIFTEQLLDKIAALLAGYGEYSRFWLGPDLNICVRNPADIRVSSLYIVILYYGVRRMLWATLKDLIFTQ